MNDDGSELQETEGLTNRRFCKNIDLSYSTISPDVWENIHSLPFDFTPPPWDGLLLDAKAALPEIGLAITLAATALEVFITFTLDRLANQSEKISPELWRWINSREFLKQPSLEERFKDLLPLLLEKSLAENKDLWEKYMHLKSARNNFVHEGVARKSKKSPPLILAEAETLVQSATDIITFITSSLPEELKWPEFNNPNIELSWTMNLDDRYIRPPSYVSI